MNFLKNMPSIVDRATDYLKDQAIGEAQGAAIEFVTGGYVTSENVADFQDMFQDDADYLFGDDEKEERKTPKSRETFNERLERELAKLVPQESEVTDITPGSQIDLVVAMPPISQPIPTGYDLTASGPVIRRAQGFGRKGL